MYERRVCQESFIPSSLFVSGKTLDAISIYPNISCINETLYCTSNMSKVEFQNPKCCSMYKYCSMYIPIKGLRLRFDSWLRSRGRIKGETGIYIYVLGVNEAAYPDRREMYLKPVLCVV